MHYPKVVMHGDGKVIRFNPIALVLFKHIFKPIGVVAI
jgi:hypothetical protein